jgi:hypothetical protein
MSVIKFDNKELDPRNIKGWFIDAFVIYKAGVFTHTFYMLCGIALSYLAFTLFHQYLSVDISIIEILAPFFSPFAFFYFYSNICKKDTDIPFSTNHNYSTKGLIIFVSAACAIGVSFLLFVYSSMYVFDIPINADEIEKATGEYVLGIVDTSLSLVSNPLLFPFFALYGFFNKNLKEALKINSEGSFCTGNNILYLLCFLFLFAIIENTLISLGVIGYLIFIFFLPYALCFNHVLFKEIYLDIPPNKSIATSKSEQGVYQAS